MVAAGLEFLAVVQVQSPGRWVPSQLPSPCPLAACLVLSLALQAGLVTAAPLEPPGTKVWPPSPRAAVTAQPA